jgi:myo-inositol-1(or 4)-monophosphatase
MTPAPSITTAVAVGSLANLKLKPGLDAVDVSVVSEVFHGDQYYAVRGGGSFFEGWGRLESSPQERLESAIVGVDTDVQDASFKALQDNLNLLLAKIKCKRRLGSSILDFCKVASGEYDAFISCGGRMILSDVAPSKILVEEAGGIFDERVIGGEKNQKDDILQRIILGGEHNLVRETKFNIIASGNGGMHKVITSELKF